MFSEQEQLSLIHCLLLLLLLLLFGLFGIWPFFQRCLKIKKVISGPLKIKSIKVKLQYHVIQKMSNFFLGRVAKIGQN